MNKALLSLIAMSFSGMALASGSSTCNMPNTGCVTGAFVNLSGGFGALVTPTLTTVGAETHVARNGIAWRVAGGYLFGDLDGFQYGAELGYNWLPSTTYTATVGGVTTDTLLTVKSRNVDLQGVVKYHVNQKFNVFAKAGAAYVMQNTNTILGDSINTNKVLPEAGAGVGYDLNDHVDLNLAYSHIFGNNMSFNDHTIDPTAVASSNTVMVGIGFTL